MVRQILVAVLLLASATERIQAQEAALPGTLVGSWRLVSYEDRKADGVVVYPYGKTPAGLLKYDSTGHMAVQIMKQPPPDVASDDWEKFTVVEKVALYDGYVAYFGRYEVDAGRGVVTHLPEADLSRLYIGRREERHFEVAGPTSNLVSPIAPPAPSSVHQRTHLSRTSRGDEGSAPGRSRE